MGFGAAIGAGFVIGPALGGLLVVLVLDLFIRCRF